MDKIMLITGANNGIGYFMSKAWLEKGNKTAVIDLDCEEINKLKDTYNDKLMTFKADVTNYSQIEKAVENVIEKYGHIDIIVHNACVCIFKNLETHTQKDYNHVMDVNFMGAVNITKAALPYLKKQNKGRICYTSSGVGITGFVNISGYAASKGAIESFAKCMVLENLDTKISFHILQPPLTDTKSSSPLPVPKEFKANPEKVGYDLIKNIYKNKFIITGSLFDKISVNMSYLFPRFTGKLLTKMTNKSKK